MLLRRLGLAGHVRAAALLAVVAVAMLAGTCVADCVSDPSHFDPSRQLNTHIARASPGIQSCHNSSNTTPACFLRCACSGSVVSPHALALDCTPAGASLLACIQRAQMPFFFSSLFLLFLVRMRARVCVCVYVCALVHADFALLESSRAASVLHAAFLPSFLLLLFMLRFMLLLLLLLLFLLFFMLPFFSSSSFLFLLLPLPLCFLHRRQQRCWVCILEPDDAQRRCKLQV